MREPERGESDRGESDRESVHRLRADLDNLVQATNAAVVFLDASLRVTFVTPAAASLLGVSARDIGLSVDEWSARARLSSLADEAREVLAYGATIEHDAPLDRDGMRFALRLMPYRDQAGTVTGVVVVCTEPDVASEVGNGLVRTLADELTRVEERERRRMARLLHDDLQQMVFGIDMLLESLRSNDLADGQAGLVDKLDGLVSDTMEKLRLMMSELRPPVRIEEGLDATLRWLCYFVEEAHGLPVRFAVDEHGAVFREEVRRLFFRAAREVLLHLADEPGIRDATMHLSEEDGVLVLGIAWSDPEREDPGRRGAQHTREAVEIGHLVRRVALLGGRMRMDAGPEGRTRITMRMPLDETQVLPESD